MKHALMVATLVGLVAFAAAPRADQSAASGSVTAQSSTLEGCLRTAAAEGEFTFTSGKDTFTVMPADGVNLAAHVNHQVQITGTVEKGARGSVLHASALKMVAATCAAS